MLELREKRKLLHEVSEREKAVENCYKSLLSESNRKLQSQEQVIRSLRESAAQKDLLLQVPRFHFCIYVFLLQHRFSLLLLLFSKNSFSRMLIKRWVWQKTRVVFTAIYQSTLELSLCHLDPSLRKFGKNKRSRKRRGLVLTIHLGFL